MPHKRVVGAESLNQVQDRAPLEVFEYQEVFKRRHFTDAHFLCYYVDGVDWTLRRMNKTILSEIRAVGGDIVTRMLALDYDNPGHTGWTQDKLSAFVDKVVDLQQQGFEPADKWTTFYTTRNGARFVYVFDEPRPVDIAMEHCRGLILEWGLKGVEIDPTCAQWGRCYRLPRVQRDDRRTDTDPFYSLETRPCSIMKWNDLPRVPKDDRSQRYATIQAVDAPQPNTPLELLTVAGKSGKPIQSQWYKGAKRRLIGRGCFEFLFGTETLQPGERDTKILKHLGQAINLLIYKEVEGHGLKDTTPELIYALFYESVMQLEPDEADPDKDWSDVLWDKTCYLWAIEDAKVRGKAEERQEAKLAAMKLSDRIIHQMRKWCDDPNLHDDDKAHTFLGKHAIAISNPDKNYYVLDGSGYYWPVPVPIQHLLNLIKNREMDELIPIAVDKNDGRGMRYVSTQDLITDYGTQINAIEFSMAGAGNYISNMGEPTATLHMKLPTRRTDLPPVFDKEVNTWLQKLGGKHYEKLTKWIGHALAFEDGAICALSIVGLPGVGRSCWSVV